MDSREEKLRKLAQRHHLADDEAATIEDILDAARTFEPSGMVLDAELEFAASELRALRAEVERFSAAQQSLQPVVTAAIELGAWEQGHGALRTHLDATAAPAGLFIEAMQQACRKFLEQQQQMPQWCMHTPAG